MPGQDGIPLARQFKGRYSSVKVSMLSIHDDVDYVARSLEAGADGFLLRRASPAELEVEIRAVHRGKKIASPSLVSDLILNFTNLKQQETGEAFALSAIELDILRKIFRGATYHDLQRLRNVLPTMGTVVLGNHE
ncbi:MAG: response regulator transcription factor [Thermomicrobiales bacterium]|nr:response regulator transcription factor [Thermomicrobiales bacterium]MCO5222916.1 response regulator [Thermomicrobiales bacterium]